jgi:IS30 family transposase
MISENQRAALGEHIADHMNLGSIQISLGAIQMPDGYALMLNSDETYYYWLRWDGVEGLEHWHHWAVYRNAKANREKLLEQAKV